MPIIIVLGVLGLAFFFLPGGASGSMVKESYPDIDASEQGGNWSTEYDEYFATGSSSYGIPFALIKAHGIRESNLDPGAFRQEPSGKASYGLMQVLWWRGSNRFAKYGFPDDMLGDGASLYNPQTNVLIACGIIRDNLNDFGNLRDAINAYNTGVRESKRAAPGNYVNDVLKFYSKLVKGVVS